MKTNLKIIGALLLLTSFSSSCDKINRAHFNHDLTVYMQINPVAPGTYTYSEVVYMNELTNDLAEYNTSIDKLESFTITGFEVWLTLPIDGSFDPFDELYAYIEAGNLGEQEIASLNPVPEGGQTYVAFKATEGTELKDFFKEDQISFRIKGSNSESTLVVTELKLTIHGKVEASVL